MDENVKTFCENYEVRVLDTEKRVPRFHPPRYFTDPENACVVRNDLVAYETERLFTIQIPEHKLNALIEMERKFFKFQKHSAGEVDLFNMLIEKEREEAYYRHTSEAVQKAYEQYSMMLNLAGYQRKF